MSHWNYRVTRRALGDDWFEYGIREVYYEDGRVVGWLNAPAAPLGDTVAGLREDLALIAGALDRPVLDITDEDNPKDVTE